MMIKFPPHNFSNHSHHDSDYGENHIEILVFFYTLLFLIFLFVSSYCINFKKDGRAIFDNFDKDKDKEDSYTEAVAADVWESTTPPPPPNQSPNSNQRDFTYPHHRRDAVYAIPFGFGGCGLSNLKLEEDFNSYINKNNDYGSMKNPNSKFVNL
jgi:hypothetical protein